jgi:hypothetical protein
MRLAMLAAFAACGSVSATDIPMPEPSVPYANVLAMVYAGGELKVAVGVPAPAGHIRVDDAPVEKGLWKCFRQGKEARMTKLDGVASVPAPAVTPTPAVSSSVPAEILAKAVNGVVPATATEWGHPVDLDGHLIREHGVKAEVLAAMTYEQKRSLHSGFHQAEYLAKQRAAAPVVQPVASPVLPRQAAVPYQQSFTQTYPSCVGGNCGGGIQAGVSGPFGGGMQFGIGGGQGLYGGFQLGGGCANGRCGR